MKQTKVRNDTKPSADASWKCVQCGCPENLTPVKRMGADGQRNICNACYIRRRANKERGMRGSARPSLYNHHPYANHSAPALTQQQRFLLSPTNTYAMNGFYDVSNAALSATNFYTTQNLEYFGQLSALMQPQLQQQQLQGNPELYYKNNQLEWADPSLFAPQPQQTSPMASPTSITPPNKSPSKRQMTSKQEKEPKLISPSDLFIDDDFQQDYKKEQKKREVKKEQGFVEANWVEEAARGEGFLM